MDTFCFTGSYFVDGLFHKLYIYIYIYIYIYARLSFSIIHYCTYFEFHSSILFFGTTAEVKLISVLTKNKKRTLGEIIQAKLILTDMLFFPQMQN